MSLDIVFVTQGLPMSGNSLERKALGGSETAFIYMAREMAKRGHNVSCYCICEEEGTFDGVQYYDVEKFRHAALGQPIDVLIVSRFADYLAVPSNAALRVLWMHDVLASPPQQFYQRLFQTDLVMCLSEFHRKNYVGNVDPDDEVHAPAIDRILWKTANGVDMDLIEKCRQPKVKNKLIFTSRPERGLPQLITEVMPRIWEKGIDATLYYCNYDISKLPHVSDEVKKLNQFCEEATAKLKGKVVNLGNLTKEELYREISSSEMWLAPSSFPEISCAAEGTLIQMPCDRSKHPYGVPIETLVGKENFPVYAFNEESGEFTLGTCKKVWKTGENRECVDIALDDGSVLTVTPEHLVMDFDGNYHRADSLTSGMRLNALHMRYNVAIKNTDGRWWDESRMVGAWKVGRELDGHKEHVNHLDPTRLDNRPGSLEVLSASEHGKKTFTGRKRTELSKRKQKQSLGAYLSTAEGQRAVSARGRARGRRWWKEVFPSLSPDEQRVWLQNRASRRKDITPQETLEVLCLLKEAGYSGAEISRKLNGMGLRTGNGLEWTPVRVANIYGRREGILALHRQNHRVVSVTKSSRTYTVYDMEVEKYHNFVAGGVVVHNCISAMEAQACGTPVVTTRDFAFPETVTDGKSGILIPGHPNNEEYFKRFANAVTYLLEKDQQRKKMGAAGIAEVKRKGFVWSKIAEKWEQKFLAVLEERWEKNKSKVIVELERNADLLPALALANQNGLSAQAETISAKIAASGYREPTSGEQISAEIKGAVLRFQKSGELVKQAELKPATVLDYASGDACFGLIAAKMWPEAKVHVYPITEGVGARIKVYAKKSGVDDRLTVGPVAEGSKFDLVFLGNVLEGSSKPEELLLFAKQLAGDGHILFTTRYGASKAQPQNSYDRLWNFDLHDIRILLHMVDGKNARMSRTEDAISPGGDIQGHFVGLFKAEDAQPRELDSLRKATKTRPYQSVAVCMIARDAEDWLHKCLKPLKDIADRVKVVLDDRTKDSTKSILEFYGVDVVEAKFDTFSQMRNLSIEGVEEDWIFWVDTDEMLIDGPRLKRYLQGGNCFEGFGIAQRHLQLDVAGHFDTPVRILRNRPEYKFVGSIHEHCLKVDKDPHGNEAIPYTMLIPDVCLAHYGYPDERRRRVKCSNRNMELLLRDVKENPERMLTWVLVMRDYLNVAKWIMEKNRRPATPGSIEYALVCAAIRLFLRKFYNKKGKWHNLTFEMYQEALKILSMSGVPFTGRRAPPFEVKLALWGAIGGVSEQNVQPGGRWFLDDQEYADFMAVQSVNLAMKMGVADENNKKGVSGLIRKLEPPQHAWDPKDTELLRVGLNAINETTGGLLR